jgi:hydroxypyruvate isomerase
MPKLLHSVPDWTAFGRQTLPAEGYYRRLRQIGFAAVEMVQPERWPAARAAGLKILNLIGPGMTAGLNRREHHAELLRALRAAIDTAARNDIAQVIVFSGNRACQSDEEGLAAVVEGLTAVAGAAAQAGVVLAFEMLNSHDHADYQADSSAYGFEVVRRVSSPAVRVLYDVYHMQRMGEDVAVTLLANLPLVCHLHFAGVPGRSLPGADTLPDYAPILRQVTAAGYGGYWGHEFVPAGDSLTELAQAFARFESFLPG